MDAKVKFKIWRYDYPKLCGIYYAIPDVPDTCNTSIRIWFWEPEQ